MVWNRYVRIVVILGMVVVMCGTATAAVGIGVQTQATSFGEYPVCTAPCECISESTAAIRWGAEGYEKCSKSICGQDAGGNVQYYCIHQVGGTVAASTTATTAAAATAAAAPAGTPAAMAAVQETMVNSTVTTAAVPATPSSTWPPPGAVPQKTPVHSATILAAIGAALLAVQGMRRK